MYGTLYTVQPWVKEYNALVNFVGREEDPRFNTKSHGTLLLCLYLLYCYCYIVCQGQQPQDEDGTPEKRVEKIFSQMDKNQVTISCISGPKQRRPSKTYFSSNQPPFFPFFAVDRVKRFDRLAAKSEESVCFFVFNFLASVYNNYIPLGPYYKK
jgi:hypothetical protein